MGGLITYNTPPHKSSGLTGLAFFIWITGFGAHPLSLPSDSPDWELFLLMTSARKAPKRYRPPCCLGRGWEPAAGGRRSWWVL